MRRNSETRKDEIDCLFFIHIDFRSNESIRMRFNCVVKNFDAILLNRMELVRTLCRRFGQSDKTILWRLDNISFN